MAQLTVRNVPEAIVRALRVRAAEHGRSAESEHRLILAEALGGSEGGFWALSDQLRTSAARQRTDSGALQREMRDRR
ncbi:MAG TPA: hypothetical protein VLH09_05455 [Bryobacteraceae bacterium]|nr:hypothetical protein [Bryobacteraceae bacterium]